MNFFSDQLLNATGDRWGSGFWLIWVKILKLKVKNG